MPQLSDPDRLKLLAKSPHLFDQGPHGSCGFAGTLMGLLVYAPEQFRDLYYTVSKGWKYGTVTESTKVKSRLEKRMNLGLLGNALDVRMSVGLMLTFKEHLREANRAQLWQDCRTYSELFEDDAHKKNWEYGGKLKNQLNNANAHHARFLLNFSYKHGDLALTVPALMDLVNMVGFKSIAQEELVSNQELVGFGGNIYQAAVSQTLNNNLVALVSGLMNGTYSGALLGVASTDFIGKAAHDPYGYIAHWVYLPTPKQAGVVPNHVLETRTWTWGLSMNIWTLMGKNYIPRVAVTFKA